MVYHQDFLLLFVHKQLHYSFYFFFTNATIKHLLDSMTGEVGILTIHKLVFNFNSHNLFCLNQDAQD